MDFTDDKKLVRFHVDDGPCVGVYYFTCQKAAKLHDVIERNRERFRMIEDLRFARLIQNEEFLQQLQSSSEFSAAMAAEQPRSAVRHLAFSFHRQANVFFAIGGKLYFLCLI